MDQKTIPTHTDRTQNDSENLLKVKVDALREQLRLIEPRQLAERAGATWYIHKDGGGRLLLNLWGAKISVSHPDFIIQDDDSGKALSAFTQALVIYYLVTTDGAPKAGEWISFSRLPDGKFYNQAFQGYSGDELRRFFENDVSRFVKCAVACGGEPLSIGDGSASFLMLPRVSLAVVAWLGDEDFPPSYQILFDASAWHHLPTDACAIAGSILTRKLIAAGRAG